MAGDTEKYGSDELTQEEFEVYDRKHEFVQDELRKVVATSEEAKRFLSTSFGISLRKTLLAEKMTAMKSCAEYASSQSTELNHHKRRYDVCCEVERIFALIISDGDEAIRQLTLTIGDDNE